MNAFQQAMKAAKAAEDCGEPRSAKEEWLRAIFWLLLSVQIKASAYDKDVDEWLSLTE